MVILVLSLILLGLALLPLRHPATKVRVLYLSKDRKAGSYIRFRPNPAIQFRHFHFCMARKRSCVYRETRPGKTYSVHGTRMGS